MAKKTKPTYPLHKVKKLIKENKRYAPKKVTETTNKMCLTITQAYEEILELEKTDFYKSGPQKYDNQIWQDVYRKKIGGILVYIKFKISNDVFVLTSFKPK